ncbi:MAG TPA: prolyl oligopeptidase family serine peptidase [Longimicrobiales bacterium]|nr:prolyl oligopeptidase family serine peptidase [Longimicrobiales bacterium]
MIARIRSVLATATILSGIVSAAHGQTRPMTFLDMQHMRTGGAETPSPDGQWLLYTVAEPDWDEAERQMDLHIVSLREGVSSSRQLTFTTDSNEGSPAWLPDGSRFLFLSNRDAPASSRNRMQLYVMRHDGGEARRITDATEGVSNYEISRDGRWLVYRSGKSGEEQLYRLPVATLDSAEPAPEQITKQAAGVGSWEWAPDSRRIYFITADTVDEAEKLRREKDFTVDIYNMETPLSSLWSIDLDPVRVTRLTRDTTLSVSGFNVSPDSRWVGFRGTSADRYRRNITEEGINTDLYLLEVATGSIERLTENQEVGESGPDFSPDGRWVAFSAPDDLTRYTMSNRRVYIRPVAERGGQFRKLGSSFDGDVGISFWSPDSRTIYFNTGVRATRQLMALDIERDRVRQVTQERAALSVDRDERTGVVLITYQDPKTPTTLFTVPSLDRVANRSAWRQLIDVNPQVSEWALGEEEEITWTSTDGKPVSGVLVKPVGYREGQRYPLIVAIHGGPASADVLGFNGGYGAQVYAGAGYAVLRPNYRGSTNYGEAHKTDIVGNYFEPGYNDIMSGVDHLIAEGIVDGDRMGALGWSAGGHWSNWILVNTDRFKAISSGAGTSNWISMYAQSDVQRNRQFYLGNELPYDDFDAYWDQSPLKYIRNAKTPTMIHVVKGDPRVPSPQSVELHMALKKIGVPTELYMYPGNSHGIPDPRNRLVKSVSEKAWMDYYVLGTGRKFVWRDVLETLEKAEAAETARVSTGGN